MARRSLTSSMRRRLTSSRSKGVTRRSLFFDESVTIMTGVRRLVLLLSVQVCLGFTVHPRQQQRSLLLPRFLAESNNDSSFNNSPSSSSRLSGNQRPPTAQELQVMDEMIDKLADAKPYELPTAVQRAFRVISSPQFFMQIAARMDQASDNQQRDKLQALASNLVSTLEAVVSTTTDRLEERSLQVQKIVAAASEPDSGEFLVPLSAERLASMRAAMRKLDTADLDQGFVSTIDTWMNKSHQDGLDGMVTILQQALQMYAGIVLKRTRRELVSDKSQAEAAMAAEIFDELLGMDADQWTKVLRDNKDHLDKVIAEIQRTMETIVLGLEAGSAVQQVQAEYLREMVTRAEAVQKEG